MEAWRQYKQFTPTDNRLQKLAQKPAEIQTAQAAEAIDVTQPNLNLSPEAQLPQTSRRSSSTLLDGPAFSAAPPPIDDEKSPIYVAFEPSDPANPQNWSLWYKTVVCGQLVFLTLSLTYASSASSSAEAGIREEFGCDAVTATAATGLFLVGMGIGAMPFAPLSELYGRLPVYLLTIFFATIFQIACSVAPSAPALLILRFIAGVFSSAPLSNAGGTLNDIGSPVSRTLMFALFSTCGFVGPVLAPVIGGFLVENPSFGWRWCFWVTAIWNGLAFILTGLFMPETLGSALLKMKAQRLRKITGDHAWRARVEDESLKAATIRALKRPFKMMAVEPAIQFFIFYLTVVYIVLYGSFSAYPYIFAAHGLSTSMIGLTFIPVMVGFVVLLFGTFFHYLRFKGLQRDADKGIERRGIHNGLIEPEERVYQTMNPILPSFWLTVTVMFGCIFFPAGLFWLAWTSSTNFSFWVPMMSGIPFGIGLLSIFQGSMQYLIDAYGPFASSALAGCTLIRYGVPGLVILGFPRMYEDLGSKWATAIFAFLGLALTPIPFVFYHYGRRVRSKCQFTVRI